MPRKPDFPKTVSFEGARVRIVKRGDGRFALSWREMGAWRRTTKKTPAEAIKWAEDKAKALASAVGKQWVTPAQAEALAGLERIAGAEAAASGRLLHEVEEARRILAGEVDLVTAARWFRSHGPKVASSTPLDEVVARFLSDYEGGSYSTHRSFSDELQGFVAKHPGLTVCEINEDMLRRWVDRRTATGAPAPRTVRNRITTFANFLNRAKDWGLLPEGAKSAAEKLRRPVVPEASRDIFTVKQGGDLLAAVREQEPKLETFLLIAGWLGLRPSECVRVQRKHFDFERHYLQVDPSVARKTARERFVPMDPRVSARLKELSEEARLRSADRVCLARSREFLSVLAREKKIVDQWPHDVLRHSFCSYRLALLGDMARVADEAGNSPRMIAQHYRRPLRREDGEAWWALISSCSEG